MTSVDHVNVFTHQGKGGNPCPLVVDAKGMSVEKRFATSKDGTRIPYFLVRKQGAAGPVPALVHAYGGFRSAQTPGYLTGQPYRAGPLGLFWVEDGNAYVLANIRGGGEYGPAWHQAALREKRQNSFDDLHAVAEDLVRTGVSAKGRIAISGRSKLKNSLSSLDRACVSVMSQRSTSCRFCHSTASASSLKMMLSCG